MVGALPDCLRGFACVYTGCFENHGSARIGGHLTNLDFAACKAHAISQNHAFFGLEYPQAYGGWRSQCLSLANVPVTLQKMPDGDCSKEVDGEGHRLGNENRLAVYTVAGKQVVAKETVEHLLYKKILGVKTAEGWRGYTSFAAINKTKGDKRVICRPQGKCFSADGVETDVVKVFKNLQRPGGLPVGGWQAAFCVGQHNLTTLQAAGVIDNEASFIQIPSGYAVSVYGKDNFTGTLHTYVDEGPIKLAKDDDLTSLKVEKVEYGMFDGVCVLQNCSCQQNYVVSAHARSLLGTKLLQEVPPCWAFDTFWTVRYLLCQAGRMYPRAAVSTLRAIGPRTSTMGTARMMALTRHCARELQISRLGFTPPGQARCALWARICSRPQSAQLRSRASVFATTTSLRSTGPTPSAHVDALLRWMPKSPTAAK